MNRYILASLILFLCLLIIACAPRAETVSPGEKELFGESAIAGQAIQVGCSDARVSSCTELPNGSIVVAFGGKTGIVQTYTYADLCSRSTLAVNWSCASSTALRRCRIQCEGTERCSNGVCLAPASSCGNGRIDRTETCSNCPADVTCREGQSCQLGRCVRTCGNRVIDPGENCSSCPADVRCATGETCQSGVCTIPLPSVTVEGSPNPRVEVQRTSTENIVQVNGAPIVGVETITEPSSLVIQIRGTKIVVGNTAGRRHYLYFPNITGNGIYICPSAQSLSEVYQGCPGQVVYTDAQCRDSSFSTCQFVDGYYKVQVTGSGGDEYLPTGTCVDSDEGRDYSTIGRVSIVGQAQVGDHCRLGQVVEFYCSDASTAQGELVDCPAGTSCSDGACQPASCSPGFTSTIASCNGAWREWQYQYGNCSVQGVSVDHCSRTCSGGSCLTSTPSGSTVNLTAPYCYYRNNINYQPLPGGTAFLSGNISYGSVWSTGYGWYGGIITDDGSGALGGFNSTLVFNSTMCFTNSTNTFRGVYVCGENYPYTSGQGVLRRLDLLSVENCTNSCETRTLTSGAEYTVCS